MAFDKKENECRSWVGTKQCTSNVWRQNA